MSLRFNSTYSKNVVSQSDVDAMAPKAVEAMHTLMSKTGEGNDFLGWIDLPTNYDKESRSRQSILRKTPMFWLLSVSAARISVQEQLLRL